MDIFIHMTDLKLKFRLKNVLDPLVLSTNYSIHNNYFCLNLHLCDALPTPLFILFIIFRNSKKRKKSQSRGAPKCGLFDIWRNLRTVPDIYLHGGFASNCNILRINTLQQQLSTPYKDSGGGYVVVMSGHRPSRRNFLRHATLFTTCSLGGVGGAEAR